MTDQETANLRIVEALYAVSAAGEWDKAAAMLTDDFFVTEAPGLPYEGVYRGRTALRDLFTKVFGMMDSEGLDVLQMTVGGDWVLVIIEIKARDEQGAFKIPLVEGLRLRDGKVCEIKPYYFDPATVQRAVDAKTAMA